MTNSAGASSDGNRRGPPSGAHVRTLARTISRRLLGPKRGERKERRSKKNWSTERRADGHRALPVPATSQKGLEGPSRRIREGRDSLDGADENGRSGRRKRLDAWGMAE